MKKRLNVIEQLYYGMLSYEERYLTDKDDLTIQKTSDEIKNDLLNRLLDEDKKLFNKFLELDGLVNGSYELINFKRGFKIGGQLAFEMNRNEHTKELTHLMRLFEQEDDNE